MADMYGRLTGRAGLISDVGLHKLWIGRMFPAHEPSTVLIANMALSEERGAEWLSNL